MNALPFGGHHIITVIMYALRSSILQAVTRSFKLDRSPELSILFFLDRYYPDFSIRVLPYKSFFNFISRFCVHSTCNFLPISGRQFSFYDVIKHKHTMTSYFSQRGECGILGIPDGWHWHIPCTNGV